MYSNNSFRFQTQDRGSLVKRDKQIMNKKQQQQQNKNKKQKTKRNNEIKAAASSIRKIFGCVTSIF